MAETMLCILGVWLYIMLANEWWTEQYEKHGVFAPGAVATAQKVEYTCSTDAECYRECVDKYTPDDSLPTQAVKDYCDNPFAAPDELPPTVRHDL